MDPISYFINLPEDMIQIYMFANHSVCVYLLHVFCVLCIYNLDFPVYPSYTCERNNTLCRCRADKFAQNKPVVDLIFTEVQLIIFYFLLLECQVTILYLTEPS